MYNFQTFGCSNDESSPNSSCHFWNHKVRVFQILHHCSLPWKITPLYFFSSNSYTLDKNSPSEWNFRTFEWLGENSPNASCHIWNHKSLFLLTLHHSSLLWEISLLYFLAETLFDFYKRSPPQCKISDFPLLRWNFTNFYFDRLLFWKCITFQLKKVWRSYISWYQSVIVCTLPSTSFFRRVEPPTKFSKRGALTEPQHLEGARWKRGGWLFFLQFLHKK